MEYIALGFAIGILLGLIFGPSKEQREASYAEGFAAGLNARATRTPIEGDS